MEADELRGVSPAAGPDIAGACPAGDDPAEDGPRPAAPAGSGPRFAWLRRYVQSRVDDRLSPGALERALRELRARDEDPD